MWAAAAAAAVAARRCAPALRRRQLHEGRHCSARSSDVEADEIGVVARVAGNKAKLGWTPTTTFEELVREMVESDYTSAKRDSLVKLAGFQAYDYHE